MVGIYRYYRLIRRSLSLHQTQILGTAWTALWTEL